MAELINLNSKKFHTPGRKPRVLMGPQARMLYARAKRSAEAHENSIHAAALLVEADKAEAEFLAARERKANGQA